MSVTDLPPRKALVELELERRMFASPHRVSPWDMPPLPSKCSNVQCPCHKHEAIEKYEKV